MVRHRLTEDDKRKAIEEYRRKELARDPKAIIAEVSVEDETDDHGRPIFRMRTTRERELPKGWKPK